MIASDSSFLSPHCPALMLDCRVPAEYQQSTRSVPECTSRVPGHLCWVPGHLCCCWIQIECCHSQCQCRSRAGKRKWKDRQPSICQFHNQTSIPRSNSLQKSNFDLMFFSGLYFKLGCSLFAWVLVSPNCNFHCQRHCCNCCHCYYFFSSINHCICPHHRTGSDWPPFSSETIRIFVSQLKIFRTSCIDRYDFHTYKFLLLFCTRRSLTHFHEKVLPSPQWSVGPVYVGPTQRSTTNKLPVMNSMRGKGCTKGPNSLQCFQWEEVQ